MHLLAPKSKTPSGQCWRLGGYAPRMDQPVRQVCGDELRLLVESVRRREPAWWSATGRTGHNRGAIARHLAQVLVDAAGIARKLPDVEDRSLADVLTVVGRDLANTDIDVAWIDVLAEVLVHRDDMDGQGIGRRGRQLLSDAWNLPDDEAALLARARAGCAFSARLGGSPSGR